MHPVLKKSHFCTILLISFSIKETLYLLRTMTLRKKFGNFVAISETDYASTDVLNYDLLLMQ